MTGLVASHDSKWVATASRDGTIIIWDTSSGAVLQEWCAHGEGVNALALSPDSRRLVSAGGHGLVVWAINNSVQKVAEFRGHTASVETCAWSPDGALIASGSRDNAVHIWDGDTFALQQSDVHPNPEDHGLLLNSEDDDLLVEDNDSDLLVEDNSEDGDLLLDLRDHRHTWTHQLCFSPDSRHLAWIPGGNCCICRCLQTDRLTNLRSYPDHKGVYILALSFDFESRRIATAHGTKEDISDACVVQIWDVATGAALTVLSGHSRSVAGISFSPDGRFLLSTSLDKSLRVWDAELGEQKGLLKVAGMSSACFSPDGKYIAFGTGKGLVQMCRTDDLHDCSMAEFTEHTYNIEYIAFSPDGEFLVSADWLGIVYMRPLAKLLEH